MSGNLARVLWDTGAVWTPPPQLTISQWADQNLYLSPEDSAEPGKYRGERAPYQKGILDAVCDPAVGEVVVMSSAQVGKTLILKAIIGYHIDQDPAPLLIVQPTLAMAETMSKDRLAPMIRDTPALKSKIADRKSRDSGNTILHTRFPGGHYTLSGANSSSSLASRPIRICLMDEVDRYPPSAGTEGDPVNLARKRTTTFWNRKIVMTSTPTIAGASRIEIAYAKSDQRRFHVPCPHCNGEHVLLWKHLIFDRDDPRESAHMVCPFCGAAIEEKAKQPMLLAGDWRGGQPFTGIAGFHLNELYSPWRRWGDVVMDFLAAKDHPELLKTWVNTSLGEPWEDRDGEMTDAATLMARRENWDDTALPNEVNVLTAGVDTQDDRLEAVIVGWGEREQAFVLSRHIIPGSPATGAPWLLLDDLLGSVWRRADGVPLKISGACLDSGGHHIQEAYNYADSRAGKNVWAIKGRGGPAPVWPVRVTKSKALKGRVHIIGVDTAKDALRSRLAVRSPDLPGYVHFSGLLEPEFFDQITIEQRKTKLDERGVPRRLWVCPAGARNESWDCLVYAFAAREALVRIKRLRFDLPQIALQDQPAMPPPQAPAGNWLRRDTGSWLRR